MAARSAAGCEAEDAGAACRLIAVLMIPHVVDDGARLLPELARQRARPADRAQAARPLFRPVSVVVTSPPSRTSRLDQRVEIGLHLGEQRGFFGGLGDGLLAAVIWVRCVAGETVRAKRVGESLDRLPCVGRIRLE